MERQGTQSGLPACQGQEGLMTRDLCPMSKGYPGHWVMHLWRSRDKRDGESGEGTRETPEKLGIVIKVTQLTHGGAKPWLADIKASSPPITCCSAWGPE